MKPPRGMPDRSKRSLVYKPRILIIPYRAGDNPIPTIVPGVKVRSHEEARIVEALVDLGIAFDYEAHKIIMDWGDPSVHTTKRSVIPDFYLPGFDLYLEHFGLYDHTTSTYRDESQRKIQTYIDGEIAFIYTLPEDVKKGLDYLKEIILEKVKEAQGER